MKEMIAAEGMLEPTAIGWSQYAVIGAIGGYLLGAVCNYCDFSRRNKLNRIDVIKKAEARSKMMTMMDRNRQKHSMNTDSSVDSRSGKLPPGGRLSITVGAAMKVASEQEALQKQLRMSSVRSSSRQAGVIEVKESNRQKSRSGEKSQSRRAVDNSLEDSKKNKLVKLRRVDSKEARTILTSVEEEDIPKSARTESKRLQQKVSEKSNSSAKDSDRDSSIKYKVGSDSKQGPKSSESKTAATTSTRRKSVVDDAVVNVDSFLKPIDSQKERETTKMKDPDKDVDTTVGQGKRNSFQDNKDVQPNENYDDDCENESGIQKSKLNIQRSDASTESRDQLSEDQVKRNQIVENISRNREGKDRRKKRITQT